MMTSIWKMTAGLAVLGLVQAISVDSRLVVVKNDCYERLAIGERLDPRDVYKNATAETVAECKMVCSQEDKRCLSFSFGISTKGNATCELSFSPVRETQDLQPIGTIKDQVFDIYIKKTDCKLSLPINTHGTQPPDKPQQEIPEIHASGVPTGYDTHHPEHPKPEPGSYGFESPRRPIRPLGYEPHHPYDYVPESKPLYKPTHSRPHGYVPFDWYGPNHIQPNHPEEFDIYGPQLYSDGPYRPYKPILDNDNPNFDGPHLRPDYWNPGFYPDRPTPSIYASHFQNYRPRPLRPNSYDIKRPGRPDYWTSPDSRPYPDPNRPLRPTYASEYQYNKPLEQYQKPVSQIISIVDDPKASKRNDSKPQHLESNETSSVQKPDNVTNMKPIIADGGTVTSLLTEVTKCEFSHAVVAVKS